MQREGLQPGLCGAGALSFLGVLSSDCTEHELSIYYFQNTRLKKGWTHFGRCCDIPGLLASYLQVRNLRLRNECNQPRFPQVNDGAGIQE